MEVSYIKLDALQKECGKKVLFDGEIDGSGFYYIELDAGERYVSAAEGMKLRVYFHVYGEAVFTSQGQQTLLAERSVYVPHPDQKMTIQADQKSGILEIQWDLTADDRRWLEDSGTVYPFLRIYEQCPRYHEYNADDHTVQRILIDHHDMPRFAMGSNQAYGPSYMEPQSHPLLDQMFFSFPENNMIVMIDGEPIPMEGNTLLHIPLGSNHGIEVSEEGQMHYLWIDFLIDPGAMAFLDNAHQSIE